MRLKTPVKKTSVSCLSLTKRTAGSPERTHQEEENIMENENENIMENENEKSPYTPFLVTKDTSFYDIPVTTSVMLGPNPFEVNLILAFALLPRSNDRSKGHLIEKKRKNSKEKIVYSKGDVGEILYMHYGEFRQGLTMEYLKRAHQEPSFLQTFQKEKKTFPSSINLMIGTSEKNITIKLFEKVIHFTGVIKEEQAYEAKRLLYGLLKQTQEKIDFLKFSSASDKEKETVFQSLVDAIHLDPSFVPAFKTWLLTHDIVLIKNARPYVLSESVMINMNYYIEKPLNLYALALKLSEMPRIRVGYNNAVSQMLHIGVNDEDLDEIEIRGDNVTFGSFFLPPSEENPTRGNVKSKKHKITISPEGKVTQYGPSMERMERFFKLFIHLVL